MCLSSDKIGCTNLQVPSLVTRPSSTRGPVHLARFEGVLRALHTPNMRARLARSARQSIFVGSENGRGASSLSCHPRRYFFFRGTLTSYHKIIKPQGRASETNLAATMGPRRRACSRGLSTTRFPRLGSLSSMR
jgi:hypothetical protein